MAFSLNEFKLIGKTIAQDVLADAEEILDAAEVNVDVVFEKARTNLTKLANKINSL